MNNTRQLIPLAIVLLGLASRHVAFWCTDILTTCFFSNIFDRIFGTVVLQVYFFSFFVLMVALVLPFVKSSVFNSWLRFAAWWLPLSAVLIATTPETSGSWMPLFFIGKDTLTMFMATLFSAMSLILIVWKQFNLGKRLT